MSDSAIGWIKNWYGDSLLEAQRVLEQAEKQFAANADLFNSVTDIANRGSHWVEWSGQPYPLIARYKNEQPFSDNCELITGELGMIMMQESCEDHYGNQINSIEVWQ